MNDEYILDGHKPIIENDPRKWADWFETADRIVAKTQIGNIRVSTVFLGIDHNFGGSSKILPILFETMTFGGKLDGEQDRYSTWEEAEKGHKLMVKRVEEII